MDAKDCKPSSDDDKYEIQAKVCKRLSRELGIDEIQFDDDSREWTPPKKHGLSNSKRIIPAYYHYHENPSKIHDIDYYKIIKDDVRNFRVLNTYQLQYITNLPHELKNELFMIYNECIKLCNEIIMTNSDT